MDKRKERKILDYVFGRLGALDVTECERPDFICRLNPSFSFGAEITEFYFSESEARIRRIEGYADELLKNEKYRHKDDKVRIPVCDVIYRRTETGQEIPLKAIKSEEYNATKVVGRFCDLVRTKNAKREEYGENVATVDLVIYDAGSILTYYSIEDWMRTIYRINVAECIMKSPFREIYVVMAREPNHHVCVPLRAAFFVSEVLAFQAIFKEFYNESLTNVTFGEYLKALAMYLAGQFEGLEYEVDDSNRFNFVFASVAVSYGEKDAGLKVRDISCDNIHKRKKLSIELNGSLDEEFGRYVAAKRPGIFCCAPIQYDACKSDEDGGSAPSRSR